MISFNNSFVRNLLQRGNNVEYDKKNFKNNNVEYFSYLSIADIENHLTTNVIIALHS